MTPERKLSITIGVMLGLIHALILWASYESLPLASYLLYGNANILPLAVTLIVDLAMVLCILLANWLMRVVERLMIALIELFRQIFPPEPEKTTNYKTDCHYLIPVQDGDGNWDGKYAYCSFGCKKGDFPNPIVNKYCPITCENYRVRRKL